jgi:hypothetical protein
VADVGPRLEDRPHLLLKGQNGGGARVERSLPLNAKVFQGALLQDGYSTMALQERT